MHPRVAALKRVREPPVAAILGCRPDIDGVAPALLDAVEKIAADAVADDGDPGS